MKLYGTAALLLVFLAGPAGAQAPGVAKPAEPTAEQKKAQEAKELQQDLAQMKAAHQAELGRLTPEIRAQAKALADKAYPSGRAALTAVVAGKHRKPGNAARDKY